MMNLFSINCKLLYAKMCKHCQTMWVFQLKAFNNHCLKRFFKKYKNLKNLKLSSEWLGHKTSDQIGFHRDVICSTKKNCLRTGLYVVWYTLTDPWSFENSDQLMEILKKSFILDRLRSYWSCSDFVDLWFVFQWSF